MQYSHIGWIPCINGHLDFGLMLPHIHGSFTNTDADGALKDTKTTRINYGYLRQNNHHARRIILQSKVGWKDSPGNPEQGYFRVFVAAKGNETDNLDERELTGTLYLYPLKYEPDLDENGKSSLSWYEPLKNAELLLENYRKGDSSDWVDIRTRANKSCEEFIQNIEAGNNEIEKHFYKVEFHINARGFIKLGLKGSPLDTISSQQEYTVIRQSYYYLKYSLHSHKHHFEEEDSLTTVIQFNGLNKHDIGLRLLGQLKRELSVIKRTYASTGKRSRCDELGVISYMNSLCESLHFEGYFKHNEYHKEIKYLESVKASFAVQTDRFDRRQKNELDVRSQYRIYIAWWISGISLFWLAIGRQVFEVVFGVETDGSNSEKIALLWWESIFIFLGVLVTVGVVNWALCTKSIKSNLDEKGLKSWIEKYYDIDDEKFRKKQWKRIGLSVFTISLTIIIIWSLDLIVFSLIS